jgi:two-component system CheB/CheR fusion protein
MPRVKTTNKARTYSRNKAYREIARLRHKMNFLVQKMLEKEQFIHSITHDVKEPLRSITLFTQLIRRDTQSKGDFQTDEYLQYIESASIYLQKLISNLQFIYESLDQDIHLSPIEMQDCVEQACENLRLKISEQEATIEIKSLPKCFSDSILLTQVFQNLIENSIKFRTEQKPQIKIFGETEADSFTLFIEDNGTGIDPDDLERIFELNFRGSNSNKILGSGHGLALCKNNLEKLGATIDVVSELGKGSSFQIKWKSELIL